MFVINWASLHYYHTVVSPFGNFHLTTAFDSFRYLLHLVVMLQGNLLHLVVMLQGNKYACNLLRDVILCDFHGQLDFQNIMLLEISLAKIWLVPVGDQDTLELLSVSLTSDDGRVWPHQLHAVSEVVSEMAATFLKLNRWS